MPRRRTPVPVLDDPRARAFAARLRTARRRSGLTQAQLAGTRYTKAFISALETGHVRPSAVALDYLAERLRVPSSTLLGAGPEPFDRLAADVALASGDWAGAARAYAGLLESAADPESQAEMLLGQAQALCRLDRGEDAKPAAARAVELFRGLERREGAQAAAYWLSSAHYQTDSPKEARRLLTEILDDIQAGVSADPDMRTRALTAIAAVAYREGQRDEALGYLYQVQATLGDTDDRRRATVLFGLAASYREVGDLEAAVNFGRRSIGLYRAAGAEREAAMIGNDLALTYLALGNLRQARALAGEAHRAFETLGDARWLAHVLESEAQIELADGDAAKARELADASRRNAAATGNTRALVSALVTRGRASAACGDAAAARADFEAALAAIEVTGTRARRREVLAAWAAIEAGVGDDTAAYRLAQAALEVAADR